MGSEPGRRDRQEPTSIERRLWVVVKAARSVQAIERTHPFGLELRVIYGGSPLWSEVFRPGDALTLEGIAAEHLRTWLSRGWELGA